MPEKDRGPLFGAYYKMENSYLYGIKWLHSTYCGGGVSFLIMYKEELPDCKGEGGEAVDFSLDSVDSLGEQPPFQHILGGYLPESVIESLHPTAAYLVSRDIQEGLTEEEILDKRAAILVPEFLGFTYEEIPEEYKGFTEVTDEEGIVHLVDDVKRCSLEYINGGGL